MSAVKAQTISGIVKDEQNAVVVNAKVSLLAKKTVISQTQTDAEGKFSLISNNGENLLLRVEAENFAVFERRLASEIEMPLEIILLPANLRENVFISITGTETRLAETPASVVVLNRETLENSAAQTIDDVLRQVPGFTLFRRSSSRTANPTTQGASLRGLSASGASRTAVLFDGVSLNDAFGGWTYWSRIPRAAVEQIEVLRGGASAVYGTSALSGAINLISPKTENDTANLRLETSAGTQETFDGSLFAGFQKQKWSASLAAESFQTAGYFPVLENERGAADARANSRHNSFLFDFARSFRETSRVFARGNLFAERRDNGTKLQKNRTYFRQAVAGVDFRNEQFGSSSLRSFIEAQVYDQTFSAISADRNAENLTRLQRVPSQAWGGNLFWSRAFAAHTISAAIETKRTNGFSDETIVNNSRPTSIVGAGGRQTLFGFFAQDFWRVNEKFTLNFGGRADIWKNSNALSATTNLTGNRQTTVTIFPNRSENSFSPQISALYQINQKIGFSAVFNRSFRAPALNELYRAFRVGNVLTLANENLSAERATSFETGARFSIFKNKLNLRGTAFFTRVSSPVLNVTLSSSPNLITRQRQNLGETRSRGVEIDFDANFGRDFQISAGYLFVDARVADFPTNADLAGKFLPQVARQQFTFQTFYRPHEKFSLSFQARAMGAQFDDDQNQFRLRPFFTLDGFASFRIRKDLEIFLAAENIFDKRFDIGLTPTRTVGAPRSIRAGLRFDLKR